jgi:hypothetical protein
LRSCGSEFSPWDIVGIAISDVVPEVETVLVEIIECVIAVGCNADSSFKVGVGFWVGVAWEIACEGES